MSQGIYPISIQQSWPPLIFFLRGRFTFSWMHDGCQWCDSYSASEHCACVTYSAESFEMQFSNSSTHKLTSIFNFDLFGWASVQQLHNLRNWNLSSPWNWSRMENWATAEKILDLLHRYCTAYAVRIQGFGSVYSRRAPHVVTEVRCGTPIVRSNCRMGSMDTVQ